MGVYIHNMEMPKTCGKCQIKNAIECNRWKLVRSVVLDRHKDCPLAPVPEHGRLGDWDDFAKRMKNLVEKANNDGFDLGAAWYSAFVRHIELTPTVIEADRGDNQ